MISHPSQNSARPRPKAKRWARRILRFLAWSFGIVAVCLGILITAFVHSANSVKIAPRIAYKPDDPQATMAEANRLSWLMNSSAAGSLYGKAEKLFHNRGDARNEAYARIGRIRGQADNMPFKEISALLGKELENPVVRADLRLKLWCLTAKGYTDLDLDPASAKRAWTEALEIATRFGDEPWETRAKGELGIIGFLEGDSGKAARLLGRALLSTMQNGDAAGQMRFLSMFGNGFNEVHRYSEAMKFFERTLKLSGASTDLGFPFMAYEGKAEALLGLGKIAEARQTLEQAVSVAETRHNSGHEAALLVCLGKLEARAGDLKAAGGHLQQAAQMSKTFGYHRTFADSQFELAKVYEAGGQADEAADVLEVAVKASREVGDRYYLPRDLTALASLKVRLGRADEADALYSQAENVIDGLLVNMHTPYWRSGLGAALSDTYLRHFELTLEKKDVARGFQIIERVRGRSAAASLRARPAGADRSPEATDIEGQISDVQVQLMRAADSSQRPPLFDKLMVLERKLAVTKDEAAGSRKEFLNRPAALASVQKSLRVDEELLEYVLDEPAAFCIAISREHAEVVRLPQGTNAVERLAQDYLSRIKARETAPELARQLYSILLSPVSIPAEKVRLVIVPDGKLHFLAFESLQDPSGKYLIESRVISYAPAATSLKLLRERRAGPRPRRSLLALGDVAYQKAPVILASNSEGSSHPVVRGLQELFGRNLENLPQTREEVLAVSRVVPANSTVLLGSSATEEAFKQQSLEDFKILHLAVHGIADVEFPDRAALILGRNEGSKEDGILQAREIMDLRLNADLVTLSACDTAFGKLQGEAGISNLEQAFFVAGARAVVASLWAADDTATTALMERFYRHLAEGHDKASALREAKLDLLEKYGRGAAPFYWAGFVLAGEGASSIPLGQ